MRRHLGCGQIYELDFGRYKGYEDKGWKPHAKYRVTRISELRTKVVPFFRVNPLFGRKLVAFEIFAELVDVLFLREHLTPEGFKRARALAAQLSEHNR